MITPESLLEILSLGAGVQSTTVYLLAMDGALHLDAAVFADTQDEPQAVYKHLEWLKSLRGPPIYVRSKGRLSSALTTVESAKYGKPTRFAAVPFFTKGADGEIGQTRRQCSREYKVEVSGANHFPLLGVSLPCRKKGINTIMYLRYFTRQGDGNWIIGPTGGGDSASLIAALTTYKPQPTLGGWIG